MEKKKISYIEIIPEEGYLLTNGEIITDYVCVPEAEAEGWSEVKNMLAPTSEEVE